MAHYILTLVMGLMLIMASACGSSGPTYDENPPPTYDTPAEDDAVAPPTAAETGQCLCIVLEPECACAHCFGGSSTCPCSQGQPEVVREDED